MGMHNVSQSSLDRFLLNHGPVLIGQTNFKVAARINGGIGAVFTALGLAFIGASLATGDAGIMAGAAGPLAAGLTNVAMALVWHAKAKQTYQPATRLSPEAMLFVHRVMRSAFGWRYKWIDRSLHQRAHKHGGFFDRQTGEAEQLQKPACQILSPQLFELLNAAAAQHNRIFGILTSSPLPNSGPIGKMKPALLQAIDETIAEVLHCAALLDKYPEGNASAVKVIQARTAALRETADRVESLVSRDLANAIEASAEASALDAVLDDLRLCDQAQKELDSPSQVVINKTDS